MSGDRRDRCEIDGKSHRPLERLEVGMEDLDVLLAELFAGELLRQTARTVLERRVYGGRNARVIHRRRLAVIPIR